MLRDYEPGDWTTDYFSLSEDSQGNPRVENAALSFPCLCCIHSTKDCQDDPCYRCGHNANSSASQRITPT